jgi:hypothetical protein
MSIGAAMPRRSSPREPGSPPARHLVPGGGSLAQGLAVVGQVDEHDETRSPRSNASTPARSARRADRRAHRVLRGAEKASWGAAPAA